MPSLAGAGGRATYGSLQPTHINATEAETTALIGGDGTTLMTMRRRSVLVATGLAAALASRAAADPACDTSTDAAAAAVYAKVTGKSLPQASACLKRSSTFAGLFVVGMF